MAKKPKEKIQTSNDEEGADYVHTKMPYLSKELCLEAIQHYYNYLATKGITERRKPTKTHKRVMLVGL